VAKWSRLTTLRDVSISAKLVELVIMTDRQLDVSRTGESGQDEGRSAKGSETTYEIRVFLLSLAALPANSRISATRSDEVYGTIHSGR
jgi:hypothetical protein